MPDFAPFEAKMRAAGQPELAIATFRHAWEQLVAGASGMLPEHTLAPVPELASLDTLAQHAERGRGELARLVIVKLNGGLGTSMGMEQAKSLLVAKDGRRFLDLIVEQVLALRQAHGVELPLVLMDSFRTQADSAAALARHELVQALPTSFLQHQVPKVRRDFTPATHADESLTWCPPGHGDLYIALATSGLLETLLAAGHRWAFVSNADNLGALPDLALLGWMAEYERAFIMECAERSSADRKGGHLAHSGAGLVLRELAQCPPEDSHHFQDITRHRWFNTNNLWVDLYALGDLLRARGGALGLPLIKNVKPIDPTDPSSEQVIQLESAMGAAIALFGERAAAVRVGRERFVPVKTTNDLLVVRSDVYQRDGDGRVQARADRLGNLPRVDLDPVFYKNIEDFELRFADGPPSLVKAQSLTVRGDVRFEGDVVVQGDVTLEHTAPQPKVIPRGSILR